MKPYHEQNRLIEIVDPMLLKEGINQEQFLAFAHIALCCTQFNYVLFLLNWHIYFYTCQNLFIYLFLRSCKVIFYFLYLAWPWKKFLALPPEYAGMICFFRQEIREWAGALGDGPLGLTSSCIQSFRGCTQLYISVMTCMEYKITSSFFFFLSYWRYLIF